jgi:iron complex outermembrane recepter protein
MGGNTVKKIHTRSQLFGKSLVALLVGASASALAEQSTGVLEEVVITAEHREESLQKAQISVSAFDQQDIADRGISNGLDLSQIAPNVNAQPYVGGKTGVSFNIRGIGNAETLISFDPAVSVYLDGVLIAKNTGALLDVLELQRIEVLRGPQGTLYGRNTMGGAVNFITQKPVDKFEGSLKGTVGNYSQHDFRGMLNVPLLHADSAGGELNLRVAAATLNRGARQRNDFAGALQSGLGTKNRDVEMAQLQWKPTDKVSVLYTYDRTRINEIPEAPWITDVNLATFFGRLLAPYLVSEASRPDSIQLDHIGIARTKVDGHALDIRWELSDSVTLESLTGYRKLFNWSEADSDGSPITPVPGGVLWTRDVQQSKSTSQEFRLVGTAMDKRLNYSTGVFYMDDKGDVYNQTSAAGSPGVNIADYKNKAWAVYGQGTYGLSDKLNLTLGARYTKEDRDMDKATFSGTTFAAPTTLDQILGYPALTANRTLANGTVVGLYPQASDSFKNSSWLVSLGYNWTDDVMTYAKISTGFQSGGFNSRDTTPTDFITGFKPEKLTSYELGLKSRWASRYQLNAAAFFSDYKDKRVNQFNPVTLASVQRNAGVVQIWGVELEGLAQLTDRLQAGLNYGHVNHKYKEYIQVNADGTTTDLSQLSNFPYSPENTASAFVSHEYPLSVGVLKSRLEWSYRDAMTFLVPQPERNSSGAVQLWNARIGLEQLKGPGDSKMRISAWGKNLANKAYWNFGVNIFSSFGFDINTYGEPRTFGVDLAIDF